MEEEEEREEKEKAPLLSLSQLLSSTTSWFVAVGDALRFVLLLLLSPSLLRPPLFQTPVASAHSFPPDPLPQQKKTPKKKCRKRNPLARFFARHGASLSVLLLLALGAGAAAHLRQARGCSALTQKLHHDIVELQNEHGHARASGDESRRLAAQVRVRRGGWWGWGGWGGAGHATRASM